MPLNGGTVLAAIMQPTYLPWVGYFDLIDQADVFVFLDTAQFEKQTWQQRNRIRTASGLEWITAPVYIKGRFGQPIHEVLVRTTEFPAKHIRALRQHYAKAPYGSEYLPELEHILDSARSDPSLARLNVALIRWVSDRLGIATRFGLASDLAAEGQRSTRLVALLRALGATRYLSPRGSLDYLLEDRQIFENAGIPVAVQNYVHPEYSQRYRPFEPGASAIDLLFNEGPAAAGIMRSGRRPSLSLNAMVNDAADAHS